ncbi:restriction endonuclease subunit S [Haloactinomyces albus]|uniref:Type I restriction enzyme S subunit n=1 Tax=Haloactinomyces albus TaxID=1352928 RepID=A0AAE3ZC75_9ACTN|nr:restriction endonuclease subunit S [Haloactinomyces albus]MDR7301006.1 type I restriction enzyme S subunit [Haloactinomyces albus]
MSDLSWRTAPLSLLVDRVVGGGTPPRGVVAYWQGDIPWVSVKDMPEEATHISATQEHISSGALSGSAVNLVHAGTPIVCTRMAVGRCAIPGTDMAINQDLKALYCGDSVDERYVLHCLNLLHPKIESVATGSTVKGISSSDILDFEIGVPSLPEQRRIAEILDTVDANIRSTERLIAKLEQTKQGIIRDVFTRYIDQGTVATRKLVEIADVSRGRFTPRPRNDPRFYVGEHLFIQTGDVANAEGNTIYNASQTLNELGASVSRKFPAGTVAVTIAANIADTAILGCSMYFPDSLVGVTPKSGYVPRYIELCIRRMKPVLESQAPQSAQRNINLQDIFPLSIPELDIEIQSNIANIYDEWHAEEERQHAELAKLRKLKQGLMDDLLTGRVRVNVDAEETTTS